MGDPLAGLDDMPWAELQHAYGPATDTPALLRRLAEGTADDHVWGELIPSLAHQGTVYEASAAAAPFLVALIHTVRGDALVGVLCLLEAVAAGGAGDAATSERCVRAAERGFARYVELLAHPQPDVREWAAKLVAWFPERARGAGDRFAAAIEAERDPRVRAELLESYDRFVDRDDEGVRDRLRALAGDPDRAVAARAAFSLVKSPTRVADPVWFDAIVRELARPQRVTGAVDARMVVRDTPVGQRAALFEAILRGAGECESRGRAFELGQALLWIAFHRRLGGPAQRPRPFADVESLPFPMPSRTGGGPPSTALEERFPGTVHWRKPGERSSEVDWVCGAHVTTWERSDADDNRWPSPLSPRPCVNVAERATPGSLTTDERRALAWLVGWDLFWRTDSDLPTVYGLPARRDEAAALLGA